jgi:hypothetical protein
VGTAGGELQRNPSGDGIILVPLLISISATIRFYAEFFFFRHTAMHLSDVLLIFAECGLGGKILTGGSVREREAVS